MAPFVYHAKAVHRDQSQQALRRSPAKPAAPLAKIASNPNQGHIEHENH